MSGETVMRRALMAIRLDLAALVTNPQSVSVDDWPVANGADASCLQSAWIKISDALDDISQPPDPAPSASGTP